MRVDEQFCGELVSIVVTRRVVEMGRTDDLRFELFVVVQRGLWTDDWRWLHETTVST